MRIRVFYRLTMTVLVLGSTSLVLGQTGPEWLSLEDGQVSAAEDKKLLFVFFEAEWCSICKRMKKETFPNDEVLSLMESRFAAVSVDIDSKLPVFFNGEEYTERSLAQAMDVVATPTMTFLDHEGKVLGETSGFYDEDRFLRLLTYLDSELFDQLTFEEYEARFDQ